MNRKSMIATGAALVLLLGGAGGAYYYVDHKKSAEEAAEKAEKESLSLFSFDSNSVKGIDITNDEGYFKMSFGDGGEWSLDETDYPYDFDLNDYNLNVIAASMSRLKADHKAEVQNGDLSKYGLDSPMEIICHTADGDHTLLVGSSSVTNEFCYVMKPDDDTVYCIDSAEGEKLRVDVAGLRDPYMLSINDSDIMQFSEVHNGEVRYDLSRVIDGNVLWTLNAPQTGVSIDAITVNTVLTNLVRVESKSFGGFTKDESELAKYGLDKPAYVFTVVTDEKTIELEFADFGPDSEEVWCYNADSCEVFSITSGEAAFLSGKWSDLTVKQAMSVPFMSAASLEINVDGETHTLNIDHEKPSYVFDGTDVTAKGSEEASAEFEYLYASVSEIKHNGYRDDVPEKMGEAACTFRYTLTDGTVRELALVPIDDNNYWAYTDGVCLGMTVEKSAVTGSSGCLNFIERLTAALA